MKVSERLSAFSRDLLSVQKDLLYFAYKLTGDSDDAHDLLQETSLRLLDNREKYVSDTNFKSWAYTVMRNLFINNYRKVLREQTYVDTSENLYQLNLSQDSGLDTPQGTVSLREINAAIDSLSADYRAPFRLYTEGYKYEEISEALSLPLGTVKSRIHYARRRLQELLRDYRG